MEKLKQAFPFIGLAVLMILAIVYLFYTRNTTDIANVTPEIQQDTNANLVRRDAIYQIRTEDVIYFQNRTGYYAEPVEKGDYPGVVMIHEWWGLNDHIKDMAEQLAEQGYRVLAVDLFGTVATTPEEACEQTSSLDQAAAVQNMIAAREFLLNSGAIKVASLGWCFGGGQSLQLSLNQDIDATVIYYGNLVTEAPELAALNGPVLGIFGSEDTSIPVESVNAFEASLSEAEIENSIHIYDGVGHAFANPSGNNYAPQETMDAWDKTLTFLAENLKQ